jgi:biotin synthase-related radical SAM superfamily protein
MATYNAVYLDNQIVSNTKKQKTYTLSVFSGGVLSKPKTCGGGGSSSSVGSSQKNRRRFLWW